ncbi:ankyrin, partial [Bimuria novae-zelandiae CBS 107.79]
MDRNNVQSQNLDGTSSAEPLYKSPKLQTLMEVFKCQLGKPANSSISDQGLGPTKQWTPFYYAVYHNREAALLHFLRVGHTPDGSPDAQPPLCIAVAAGHVDMVKILCEAGANLNVWTTRDGETPLHLAIKAGRSDILALLIRHKPDLNTTTLYTHETALHYAAARASSIDNIIALLKNGANCEALDNEGRSPARMALQARNLETAIVIIRAAGSKSHRLAKEKRSLLEHVLSSHNRASLSNTLVAQALELACPPDSTTLVEAIKTQDPNLVQILLERGANPNKATRSGLFPIFAAFNACSAPIVQALVEHGADVTLRNPHGPNVLQAALASPVSRDKEAITKVFEILLARGADARTIYSDGTTLLHHAVGPDVELVKVAQQLLQYGVNVDVQDKNGNTALHVAAMSPTCVAMLLKHGANPNLVNSKNLTPLLYALKSATSENESGLQQLLKASDIGKVDTSGKGALHLAAQNGMNKTTRMLLEAGADTTSTDSKKRTPLLLAVLHQQWAVVPLLAIQPGTNSWDEPGMTALHHIAISTPKAPSTWKHIAAAAAPFCEKGVSRSMRDQSGSTPLIQAAKTLPEEGLPIIEVLLSQNGSERGNCVAHEDHDQRNALYYAATLGKVTFVEALLRHGTPFSLSEWRPRKRLLGPENGANKRILKLLAEYEWPRRMARLHRQSATSNEALLPKVLPIRDLNDMLTMGLDPNQLPRTKPAGSLLWTLLDHGLALSTTHPEYLHGALKLILAFGADPNALFQRKLPCIPKIRNSQQAPLAVHPLARVLEMCPRAELNLVRMLIDAGAKLSIPSPLYDGRYPLHSAVQANRVDIVELMLHHKADVDCTNAKKRTPLFVAAESGSSEIVELLLRARASVNASDDEGCTPLHAAAAAGNASIVSCLLRAGGRVDSRNHKELTPLRCLPEKLPEQDKHMIASMLERAQQKQ